MFSGELPGVVSFLAQPNSNSSVYVEWNATMPNTDPLLIRYLVTYNDLFLQGNETTPPTTVTLLSHSRNITISGLRTNAIYVVGVAASSLAGRSQEGYVSVSTFPNGECLLLKGSSS